MLNKNSIGIELIQTKLNHKEFNKIIKNMIENNILNIIELNKILINPEIQFVSDSDIQINNNPPSVSIVLPTYNDEDVISACLKTLINQTYQKIIEIVVIDDGSTDESLNIITDIEKANSNIHVIKSKHLGRSAARNIGLKEIRGDIVHFAESDAIYSPWYIDHAIDIIMKKKADAIMMQGSWIMNTSFISKCILILDQIKWGKIKAGKKIIDSAWIYKTNILRQVAGFDELLESGEDKELFRRVSSLDVRIDFGLGYNWFHPTPNNLKQYLKRIKNYQIKKTIQNRKKGKIIYYLPVLITLIIIWIFFPVLGSLIGMSRNISIGIQITPLILFYFIRMSSILKERKYVSHKRYIILLPLISILAIIVKIYGMILGNIKY